MLWKWMCKFLTSPDILQMTSRIAETSRPASSHYTEPTWLFKEPLTSCFAVSCYGSSYDGVVPVMYQHCSSWLADRLEWLFDIYILSKYVRKGVRQLPKAVPSNDAWFITYANNLLTSLYKPGHRLPDPSNRANEPLLISQGDWQVVQLSCYLNCYTTALCQFRLDHRQVGKIIRLYRHLTSTVLWYLVQLDMKLLLCTEWC